VGGGERERERDFLLSTQVEAKTLSFKTFDKGTCTPMFVAALTIAKLWKQPRCPTTDEWIKKM
jgi:hypothetical protein